MKHMYAHLSHYRHMYAHLSHYGLMYARALGSCMPGVITGIRPYAPYQQLLGIYRLRWAPCAPGTAESEPSEGSFPMPMIYLIIRPEGDVDGGDSLRSSSRWPSRASWASSRRR